MKTIGVLFLLLFALSSCAAIEEENPISNEVVNTIVSGSKLPDLGKAPEIHNEIWINTDGPLQLEGLSGKVVILEMWTFG